MTLGLPVGLSFSPLCTRAGHSNANAEISDCFSVTGSGLIGLSASFIAFYMRGPAATPAGPASARLGYQLHLTGKLLGVTSSCLPLFFRQARPVRHNADRKRSQAHLCGPREPQPLIPKSRTTLSPSSRARQTTCQIVLPAHHDHTGQIEICPAPGTAALSSRVSIMVYYNY